jgi:hypothetical protein
LKRNAGRVWPGSASWRSTLGSPEGGVALACLGGGAQQEVDHHLGPGLGGIEGDGEEMAVGEAPLSMAMAWTVGGRVPFCTELWLPGLKLMAMASSPSSSNCLVSAAPVGKSLPFRQSAG